ncbi:MAG: hypothetical protein OXQ28_10305 [Acidobacteriota bacterium]|nr:hypothetical protein [Acidobacteriota bacterium]
MKRLSTEEREILDRFERGELRSVADVERQIEAARQAARKASNGRRIEKAQTDR